MTNIGSFRRSSARIGAGRTTYPVEKVLFYGSLGDLSGASDRR